MGRRGIDRRLGKRLESGAGLPPDALQREIEARAAPDEAERRAERHAGLAGVVSSLEGERQRGVVHAEPDRPSGRALGIGDVLQAPVELGGVGAADPSLGHQVLVRHRPVPVDGAPRHQQTVGELHPCAARDGQRELRGAEAERIPLHCEVIVGADHAGQRDRASEPGHHARGGAHPEVGHREPLRRGAVERVPEGAAAVDPVGAGDEVQGDPPLDRLGLPPPEGGAQVAQAAVGDQGVEHLDLGAPEEQRVARGELEIAVGVAACGEREGERSAADRPRDQDSGIPVVLHRRGSGGRLGVAPALHRLEARRHEPHQRDRGGIHPRLGVEQAEGSPGRPRANRDRPERNAEAADPELRRLRGGGPGEQDERGEGAQGAAHGCPGREGSA